MGKDLFGLLEHLKEQPVSPRMDSLADRDTCGVGKAKREQRESRSSPLCPDQASSDPDQPWQHLLNPSQERCHSPREEPSTPKQQGHPGPQQGAGMGRRTYERVRKELNPRHCPPSLLLLCNFGRKGIA